MRGGGGGGGKNWCTFHIYLSPLDPSHAHAHHDCRGPDADEGEGGSTVETGVTFACTSDDGAEPDSARVSSSAARNRSSNAALSRAAFSCAALVSSSGIGLWTPYAHEPTTTAATVNPCATMRTRSQLLSERDWPLRIFVIAITSATVVAAAPV
jgi:hypothetical protein